MTWFYCSFAREDKFLGAVVVRASTIEFAVIETHRLGINPGGECIGYPLVNADVPDEKWCNRLLSKENLDEIWPGQMVRYEDLDTSEKYLFDSIDDIDEKMWN